MSSNHLSLGAGGNILAIHHPLSENRNFSPTKVLVDLRPVCKLEFVGFVQLGKTRALYLYWFNLGSPPKFETPIIFQKNLRGKVCVR